MSDRIAVGTLCLIIPGKFDEHPKVGCAGTVTGHRPEDWLNVHGCLFHGVNIHIVSFPDSSFGFFDISELRPIDPPQSLKDEEIREELVV